MTRRKARRTATAMCAMSSASPRTRCASCRPSLGGAFGCGLRPQYQLFLAAMAAIALKRLGQGHAHAAADASAASARGTADHPDHRAWAPTRERASDGGQATTRSPIRPASRTTRRTSSIGPSRAVPLRQREGQSQAGAARSGHPDGYAGPRSGAAGVYALECAMDELSYAMGIDPLELRLKNYSELRQDGDKPLSSKELRIATIAAPRRFGWSKRNPEPRSMRDGARAYRLRHGERHLGSIAASRPAPKSSSRLEGRLAVSTAAADIGTRHVHHHDADRRRDARPAARSGRGQDRRFRSACLPRRRRVLDGGLGGLRRHAGLRRASVNGCFKRAQKLEASPLNGRRARRRRLRRRQDRAHGPTLRAWCRWQRCSRQASMNR